MPIRRGKTLAETLTCLPEMIDAGVNVFRFGTAACKSVDEMCTYIDELADVFAPYRAHERRNGGNVMPP